MREPDAAGVLSSHFARLEEEDGLTEDLGQVGAIDLVEDEEGPAVLRQPAASISQPGRTPNRRLPAWASGDSPTTKSS
jgi:hypothetical protein